MMTNGLTSQPAINRSFLARGIVTGWPRLAASEAKGRLGETHRRIFLSRDGGSSRARRPERPGRKNHQRVQKATTGATTDYIFDVRGALIAEANDSTGSTTLEYVWMEGQLLAQIDSSGNIYYVHNNQVNAPQKMTDASRTLVWDYETEPFGEYYAAPTNTDSTNHRFPGQYADAEDLLSQNNNREYDPTIGYIEADPSGFRGGLNLFGYAGQNPTQNIDPSGLDSFAGVPSYSGSGGAYNPAFYQNNSPAEGLASLATRSALPLTPALTGVGWVLYGTTDLLTGFGTMIGAAPASFFGISIPAVIPVEVWGAGQTISGGSSIYKGLSILRNAYCSDLGTSTESVLPMTPDPSSPSSSNVPPYGPPVGNTTQ
jgi:RHS repeat-associated protein